MKKIISSLFIMLLTLGVFAQETANVSRQAVFNAKKSVFETSNEPNTIVFIVNGIKDEQALEQLKKTGSMYVNHFSVDIQKVKDKDEASCKVVFNDKTKTGILNRFFVANNIQEIIINNSKVNREQFFNTPESW